AVGPAVPAPDCPPYYLPRPRLLAQLDAATHGPVTLVSAPPGWGKTVALSAWARARPATERLVWLGTDPRPGTGDRGGQEPFWHRLLGATTDRVTVVVDGGDDLADQAVLTGLEQALRAAGG